MSLNPYNNFEFEKNQQKNKYYFFSYQWENNGWEMLIYLPKSHSGINKKWPNWKVTVL